jgi:hypothetical protein
MPQAQVTVTRSEPAARLAYDLSAWHCGTCRSYHAIWPYLRLMEPARGVDADRELLTVALAPFLEPGAAILLAGSADAGLAECVLDAAGDRPVDLTVMDLCDTPLRQCDTLLRVRAGGRLRTIRGSITGRAITPPADLLVANSVLSFLSTGDLVRAAAFVADSLRPGGRLVLSTSLGTGKAVIDTAGQRLHVLAQLATLGVPLPADEPVFAALLDDYARGRARRASPFADEGALLRWLGLAGLTVETLHDLRRGTGFDPSGAPQPRMTAGGLVVALKAAA